MAVLTAEDCHCDSLYLLVFVHSVGLPFRWLLVLSCLSLFMPFSLKVTVVSPLMLPSTQASTEVVFFPVLFTK